LGEDVEKEERLELAREIVEERLRKTACGEE
jgi:hypothetical protein